jgi:hypothetical protein
MLSFVQEIISGRDSFVYVLRVRDTISRVHIQILILVRDTMLLLACMNSMKMPNTTRSWPVIDVILAHCCLSGPLTFVQIHLLLATSSAPSLITFSTLVLLPEVC